MASFDEFVRQGGLSGPAGAAGTPGPAAATARTHVVAYTDGSARRNPGPGGYGVVLLFSDHAGRLHSKMLSQGFRRTTNNRMELLAAIVALETLSRPCTVELHSDSQYLVNAINKRWVQGWMRNGWKTASKKPVKNPDLWKRLVAAMRRHDVEFVWVKGHAGHKYNEKCDELATSAADGKAGPLAVDAGFEE
ncbi:MAG: ribonuclease HI [Olsenella sp.]|nr:ribonuclease HI [Olsenella sp.]